MKYNILINQKYFADKGLDIKDVAILEYIKGWCSVDSKKTKQMTLEENGMSYRYTWINFNHLIVEMPLLGIKQKASISDRIANIAKKGFIKTFRAPDNTLYVRLLDKIRAIEFDEGVSNAEQPEVEALVLANDSVSQDEQHKHSTKEHNTIKDIPSGISGKEVNDLIEMFRPVNPAVDTLFSRPPQRNAIVRLVKICKGRENLERTIRYLYTLPEHKNYKYAPKITSPVQLENNLGRLIAFHKGEQSDRGGVIL